MSVTTSKLVSKLHAASVSTVVVYVLYSWRLVFEVKEVMARSLNDQTQIYHVSFCSMNVVVVEFVPLKYKKVNSERIFFFLIEHSCRHPWI